MPHRPGFTDSAYRYMQAVIAHRGASGEAPENTLAAFRLAIQQGARWIETDVCLSADGHAVLFHDEKLGRCSNGSGWLLQKDLAELKKLDAGSWFDPAFAGEQIPTLGELVALAEQRDIGLNLEIKPVIGREAETVWAISKVLASINLHIPVLLSSFNPLALMAARERMPHITRALLTDAIPYDWEARLQRTDCSGLHFCADLAEPALIQDIREHGYEALAYTVNSPDQAVRLQGFGVSAVFTDYPARMLNGEQTLRSH